MQGNEDRFKTSSEKYKLLFTPRTKLENDMYISTTKMQVHDDDQII